MPLAGNDAATIAERIRAAKHVLGKRVIVLGHHYQRDEVIAHADVRGDSYDLSKKASAAGDADYIVFCGVHFMAETADIVRRDGQSVYLPDWNAGCSMADMARLHQIETCWDELSEIMDVQRVVPITYMNSSAAIKAFCGRHGGAVCTSSNAEAILRWAFDRGDRVVFLPDQHLGRNTGTLMGLPLAEMPLWDPALPMGGQSADTLRESKIILWRGHCSVHINFMPEHVTAMRAKHPGIRIMVHPECRWDVVQAADVVGSTATIVATIQSAPAGSHWAIGTEHHLVERLAHEHPHLRVRTLAPMACQCMTMYRIDPLDLAVCMEQLAAGTPPKPMTVPPAIRRDARLALTRMLDITEAARQQPQPMVAPYSSLAGIH